MNRILYRMIGALAALMILAVVGYQVYANLLTPYRTETAYEYLQSDYIATDGVAVRDETALTAEHAGIVSYLRDDGEKVSASMPVAEIYATEQDAENQAIVKKLQYEIERLEEAADPGRAEYINAEVLGGQISDRLAQLAYLCDTRDIGGLETVKTDYLMLLNTRQIATARATDFNDRLLRMRGEAETLAASTQPAVATVSAVQSGYFVGFADGYEQDLTVSGAADITPERLMQIVNETAQASQSAVGKIVTDFEWYYVALVPEKECERLRNGMKLTVTFPYISDDAYPAVVSFITRQEGQEYAAVGLRIDEMNAQVCAMRVQRADLSFASYRGLKVRADALRFQQGQPGVYVMNAAGVRFKKLDIVFYGDGFVLSRQRSESGYLALYDEMVVQGRELAQDA